MSAAPPARSFPSFRLRRLLVLAWMTLAWERICPALLPLWVWGAGLAALVLLDVPAHVSGTAAQAGGLVFTATGLLLGLRVIALFDPPGRQDCRRRIERDSSLAHQPLSALEDRPAAQADPVAQALWQEHLRRIGLLLPRLRVGWPSPGLAARDPWGWRVGAALVLVIAVTVAGGRGVDRLLRIPSLLSGAGADQTHPRLQAWIVPPDYTGNPPRVLQPGDAAITVPAGTIVKVTATQGWGRAWVAAGTTVTSAEWRQSDGSQHLEAVIAAGDRLIIGQGVTAWGHWGLAVQADAAPSAQFAELPSADSQGRLRLAVGIGDDHGVARAWIEMTRQGQSDAPVRMALPLAATLPTSATVADWVDLTGHPWAGLPVSLVPVAEDALGQRGQGAAVDITLPERTFTNPVAQVLATLRKQVMEDRGTAHQVAAVLSRLTAEPSLLKDDLTVFLALRMTLRGLLPDDFDQDDAQSALWQSALRLEDGDLADAQRHMDQARRELAQALENGAGRAELERLLQRYEAALRKMIEAMADQASGVAGGEAGVPLDSEALQDVFDEMRDLAGIGARDALRERFEALNRAMDSLRLSPQSLEMGRVAAGLGQLRTLTRRQQDLMDGLRSDKSGGDGAATDAERQSRLRRDLEEAGKIFDDALGHRLGAGTRGSLEEAGQAMERAEQALRHGRREDALQAQSQAVDALRDAASEIEARLQSQSAPGRGGGLDPLGRAPGGRGVGDDGSTHVPQRGDVQRVRRILDDLRQRAGDWRRPVLERDYLDRLLRQF